MTAHEIEIAGMREALEESAQRWRTALETSVINFADGEYVTLNKSDVAEALLDIEDALGATPKPVLVAVNSAKKEAV